MNRIVIVSTKGDKIGRRELDLARRQHREDLLSAVGCSRLMRRPVFASRKAVTRYLRDLDGNGVELYRDRLKEMWSQSVNGALEMLTRPLDLDGLIAEVGFRNGN